MQASSSSLIDVDLSDKTLQTYLDEDSTFVEYLNSFLLLPTFSNKLFYNKDIGYFEQVHSNGMVCWDSDVTPSSSMVTLYLPEDTMGPSLDKEQSCEWIVHHRLPLFLRSDLYSEYKLSRLLSRPGSAASLPGTIVRVDTSHVQSHSYPAAPESDKLEAEDAEKLPGKSTSSELLVDDKDSDLEIRVPASRSHMDLVSRLKKSGRRVKFKRSLSVDPRVPSRSEQQPPSPGTVASSSSHERRASTSSSVAARLMSVKAMHYLSSKCGMNALWKFLKGTAGERNWLFWLDAERIKYYSKDTDQQRLIKDLRERYLHCGSPLELPPETRMIVKLSKSGKMTTEQIQSLQDTMIERLREYWCPRFLLHRYKERRSSSISSVAKVPKLFHSCSSAPGAFQGLAEIKPSRPITPLTPTQTPTFMRLGRPRPKSSTPAPRKFSESGFKIITEKAIEPKSSDEAVEDKGAVKVSASTDRQMEVKKPDSSSESDREGTSDGTAPAAGVDRSHSKHSSSSRKIWSEKGSESGEGERGEDTSEHGSTAVHVEAVMSAVGGGKGRSAAASAEKFSKLAKYAVHHLPHPESRCASRLEGADSSSSICKNRCQILSVAGTPVQSVTSLAPIQQPDTSSASSETKVSYESLLQCLAMENRKAGGYFMRYLEGLENGVFNNCLQFWREVQQYKALFVQKQFSPCAVELKAKAVFGHYISKCCSQNIDCSAEILTNISANLWPAYEDLFDEAEEYALNQLYSQWNTLCSAELDQLQKLDTIELSVSLSDRDFSVSDFESIEGLSYLSSSSGADAYTSEDSFFMPPSDSYPMHAYPSTSSSVASQPPITLTTILNDPEELEHFKVFLNDNCAAEDLMCWMDIEAFRGISAFDKAIRKMKAKQLRKQYFTKGYYFGPNSPATKEEQRQTIMAGGAQYGAHLPPRPRTPVFREAQKHVQARLEKMWLVRFINTPEFLERNRGTRLFRSTTAAKMKMHSTTVEYSFLNSHQAILFRKFLLTRRSPDAYLRFLKIKAMYDVSTLGIKYPKEDLHFWYEVQKYKNMYHVHTTESTLDTKVTAIIDCFFESSVPPQLQIDIPLSLADLVLRKPSGPYLFRETQAVIFKLLYNGWKEFKTFSNGLDSRQLKKALDKLERSAREAKRTKKQQEERMKQEEERRRSMLPHFETAEERELRLKKERELEEFGKVAVEFSLANPQPASYVYFTALPEDQSVLTITSLSSSSRSDVQQDRPFSAQIRSPMTPASAQISSPVTADPTAKRNIKFETTKHLALSKIKHSKKRSRKRVVEKNSIVKMTLRGKTPDPNPRRIEADPEPSRILQKSFSVYHVPSSVAGDHLNKQPSPRDLFLDVADDQQRLRPFSPSPTSQSRLALKRSMSSRKFSPGVRRRALMRDDYPPARASSTIAPPSTNTIRMQYSGHTGKPYAYGSGLPEDSYLTIKPTVTPQATF